MNDYDEKSLSEKKKDDICKALIVRCVLMGTVIILAVIGHFAINYFYPENNGTGMSLVIIGAAAVLLGSFVLKHPEVKLK